MSNRPRLIHLLLILLGLGILAAGAMYYTNASDSVEGLPVVPEPTSPKAPNTPETCAKAGGVWNECASACPPDAQVCTMNCVRKCEGLDDGMKIVDVYFPNSKLDPQHLDCGVVFPVHRAVELKVADQGGVALEALLRGPTEEEKESGYFTTLPEGLKLDNLTMRKGTAHADFSKELSVVAGSCRVIAIRAQIESTLKQYPGVSSAVISVDGRFKDALQP